MLPEKSANGAGFTAPIDIEQVKLLESAAWQSLKQIANLRGLLTLARHAVSDLCVEGEYELFNAINEGLDGVCLLAESIEEHVDVNVLKPLAQALRDSKSV